jgi:hypothetical protein
MLEGVSRSAGGPRSVSGGGRKGFIPDPILLFGRDREARSSGCYGATIDATLDAE